MANTLYDFYGGKLPSISERAKTYSGYGLGGNYTGTAAQNIALLGKLQSGGGKQGGAPVGTVITPNSPQDVYNQAVKAYQDYYTNAETPEAAYRRLSGEQDISGVQDALRTIAGNLNTQQGLLKNLEPDINTRTAGFDVNESQRRQILAKESEPLVRNIEDLTRSKAVQQEDLNTRLGIVNALLQAAGLTTAQKAKPLEIGMESAKGGLDQYLKEQESQKDYDRQVALTKLSASLSRSGSGGLSAKDKAAAEEKARTTAAVGQLSSELQKVAGGDGYVSPNDYNKARRAWSSQGFDPSSFDSLFAGFRNPGNPWYGVK